MAAFALHVALVISSAYSVSGIVLVPVVMIALSMRWHVDRKLIVPMMSWGAVGVVAMAFALRTLQTFGQG